MPEPRPFHLVDRYADLSSDADTEERRELLLEREPPRHRNLKQSAANLQIDGELETAINAALCLDSPLLITGEPGTGKTSVAYYLAHYFGLEVYPFHVKSSSTVQDMQYDFDAVAYLHWAYQSDANKDRIQFTQKGALWQAYDDERGAVVLIDEIDKASRDFPNDLLLELDAYRFAHPFDKGKFVRNVGGPCITIITSNGERRLPDAFLRRCVYHGIRLDEETLRRAVEVHVGSFPNLDKATRERALQIFRDIRELGLDKPPGTSELLGWLAVLSAQGRTESDLDRDRRELPALCTLIKDPEDIGKL